MRQTQPEPGCDRDRAGNGDKAVLAVALGWAPSSGVPTVIGVGDVPH
jgi:hypothetical protein